MHIVSRKFRCSWDDGVMEHQQEGVLTGEEACKTILEVSLRNAGTLLNIQRLLDEGVVDSQTAESTAYMRLLFWPCGNVKIYNLTLFLATPALK